MGELLPFKPKQELSPTQRAHWERQLEIATRQVEMARRVLGLVMIEEGEENGTDS